MELANLLLIIGLWAWQIAVLLFFILVPVALMIWAIIDLVQSTFADSTNKLIWALVIIFMPLIGAVLYLIVGRKQKAVIHTL